MLDARCSLDYTFRLVGFGHAQRRRLRRVLIIVILNLFVIWCLCPPWRDLFGSYGLPAGLLMLNNKQKAYVQTVWARDLEFIIKWLPHKADT